MKPVWDSVRAATLGSGVIYIELNEDVAKTPGIDHYPTIIMIDESGRKYEYKGGPNFASLRDWIVSPTSARLN